MKTELYYFTGTGNSLVVAKNLGAKLDATVISIASVISAESITSDAEVIGIIFPVYMGGLPLIIRKFVSKLTQLESKYIVAVCTYGGMLGGTMDMLSRALQKAGGKLSVGLGVQMPGNYIPMYGAKPEDKQTILFSAGEAKCAVIAQNVLEKKVGLIEKSGPVVNFLIGILYKLSASHIPSMDRKFSVDEKCNGCGICAKVCPVNNIKIENQKPTWTHHCEQCMACLQWCPQEAIQAGSKTAERKRYHHPEVKVTELFSNH